jgi:hypothetical protein
VQAADDRCREDDENARLRWRVIPMSRVENKEITGLFV